VLIATTRPSTEELLPYSKTMIFGEPDALTNLTAAQTLSAHNRWEKIYFWDEKRRQEDDVIEDF